MIAQPAPRSAASAGQAGRRGRASEQATRRVGSTKRKKQAPGASRDALKAKEEEYRRRNDELEAKTAELVKEAEHLMKGNLSILSDLETSDSTPPDSEHQQRPTSTLDSSPHPSPFTSSHPHTTQSHIAPPHPHPPDQPSRPHTSHPHTSHPHTSHTHTSRPHTTHTNQKPKKTLKTQTEIKGLSSHAQGKIPLVEPIVSVAMETVVQRMKENFEAGAGEGAGPGYHSDDIIPEAAEEMGPEALIRFLKAKLRVTQEELDRLCEEMGSKDKQLQLSETKLKELTEQNSRLQRTHQSLQSQLDKHRTTAEAMKHKSTGLEAQLVGLRKDMEGMRGQHKKAAGHHSALEVRLNRAVEETEKYKMELASLRARADDSSKSERLRMEQLAAENKQLERQRNELVAAFKKQMKLIDILKRQKMHIEAAKLLSFTEEEFVKALDWQAS